MERQAKTASDHRLRPTGSKSIHRQKAQCFSRGSAAGSFQAAPPGSAAPSGCWGCRGTARRSLRAKGVAEDPLAGQSSAPQQAYGARSRSLSAARQLHTQKTWAQAPSHASGAQPHSKYRSVRTHRRRRGSFPAAHAQTSQSPARAPGSGGQDNGTAQAAPA